VIRDVTQLRKHGQVERRVDELDVDVATWRAGMRAAARREGMRIRTFVVEPGDPLTNPDARPDPTDVPPPGTLVFAVRTDLPVDPAALAAAVNAMPAPPPEVLARLNRPPADVVALDERRASNRPDRS
jgi:hypothetical protein